MLSLTCKTAIKAVIYLASKLELGEKTGIEEIAGSMNASKHTVGKMLQNLVKKNIINSIKGPNGGFFITDQQYNQPVINIIEAIDGVAFFDRCGLGLNICSGTHPCPLHDEYSSIRDRFKLMCLNNKISDLHAPVNDGLAHLLG